MVDLVPGLCNWHEFSTQVSHSNRACRETLASYKNVLRLEARETPSLEIVIPPRNPQSHSKPTVTQYGRRVWATG